MPKATQIEATIWRLYGGYNRWLYRKGIRRKKEGMSVFDPVFVLSAILDWAGIAHNERGYLELTADYRTRAEGR